MPEEPHESQDLKGRFSIHRLHGISQVQKYSDTAQGPRITQHDRPAVPTVPEEGQLEGIQVPPRLRHGLRQ